MPILIVTKNMTGHHPRHSNGNDEYSVVQVISIITYYIALVKRQNLPVTALDVLLWKLRFRQAIHQSLL